MPKVTYTVAHTQTISLKRKRPMGHKDMTAVCKIKKLRHMYLLLFSMAQDIQGF